MKSMRRFAAAAIALLCVCQSGFTQSSFNFNEITADAAASVRVDSSGRKMEQLNRGVSAVSNGSGVFVSWRSLEEDPTGAGFNVYRTTDGVTTLLNSEVLYDGTNYTDSTADLTKDNTYTVKMVVGGVETDSGSGTISAGSTANCTIIPINSGSTIHFVWVGDFDGDGSYDYLVDRCADDHQKLEAYLSDGTYLWTIDLGENSENKNNISPGASTIDVGMWDGATVYDIDCDGYADVLLRIADGVTFGDGSVYSSSSGANGQAIAVIDGKTGALKSAVDIPTDYLSIGPMACMMEVGYLDGVNPSLICWMKNRNSNKTFNSLTVAYTWQNGEITQQWKYDNKNYYAEAHQIRVADVDYDGKDEVLHMGYALNSDGTLRYHMDDVVHGDRWYVGAFSSDNEGNAMMGYGIQQENASGLLEYFYNASTGEILWSNSTTDGSTYDVARGNVGDIDPNYDGFECWSFQGTFNQDGTKITDSYLYPVIRLWWDGDLLSESYNDGKIEKWNYETFTTSRVATTWKITDCTGSDRGAPMFYGDITGDWREEVIMTSSDYSSLVILSTTTPTDIRNECLAQDPCYRNCMTAKGYYQSHMLDYYLGSGMETKTTKSGAEIDTSYKYTIKNVNSGMYLAVENGTAASGTTVIQSEDSQTWTLADGGDGYYYLYSEVGDGSTYLLDIDYGKTDDGTKIGIYTNTNSDAQLFKFVDNGDGSYTITTKVTDDASCLGVDNMSLTSGADVLEWTSNGTSDQSWILEISIDEINGNLIQNLAVKDTSNYMNWGITENVQIGSLIYGDREFTYTELPQQLLGTEAIQTACDSKSSSGELAEFNVSEDVVLYAALDSRVTEIPDWLSDWEATELTASSSNDVTYVIYKKSASAGETITLGENGQSANCVNYVIFASSETGIMGDANEDGEVTIADAVLIMSNVGNTTGYTISAQGLDNSDVYARGDGLSNQDALAVQKFISGALTELPESYS